MLAFNVGAELGSVFFGEDVTKGLQGAERFFEVVRDDVSEILEFGVDLP